jgi:hypothetical protein
MLIMVAIVAIVSGWKVERMRRQQAAHAELSRLGIVIDVPKWWPISGQVSWAPCYADCAITDEQMKYFAELGSIKCVCLYECPNVTDRGLKHLHGLIGCETILVMCPNVTSEGIADLERALPKTRVMLQPDCVGT